MCSLVSPEPFLQGSGAERTARHISTVSVFLGAVLRVSQIPVISLLICKASPTPRLSQLHVSLWPVSGYRGGAAETPHLALWSLSEQSWGLTATVTSETEEIWHLSKCTPELKCPFLKASLCSQGAVRLGDSEGPASLPGALTFVVQERWFRHVRRRCCWWSGQQAGLPSSQQSMVVPDATLSKGWGLGALF